MADDEMRRLNIGALQDEGVIFLWVTGAPVFCCQFWLAHTLGPRAGPGFLLWQARHARGAETPMACARVASVPQTLRIPESCLGIACLQGLERCSVV